MRITPNLILCGICWLECFCLAPAVTSQEPASEQRRIIKVVRDRKVTPERHRLAVRQPDGTPAQALRIIKLPDDFFQQSQLDMASLLKREPVAAQEGVVELDLSDTQSYYVLRSDTGMLTLSSPRLLAVDEIQLQPFAKLTVSVLRGGQPTSDVPVEVLLEETSDGMQRIQALKVIGKTDAKGIAIFEQLPLGKVQIALDRKVTQIRFGRSTGTGIEMSAMQTTRLNASQTTEVKFGEGTRAVRGKFEFPADVTEFDRDYFRASLIYDNYDRRVSAKLHADGSFTCEDAPIGQAAIEIRGPILARERSRQGVNFVDRYLVEIKDKLADASSAQDLGTIRLVDRHNHPMIPARSTPKRKPASLAGGLGPVAWVALVDFEGLANREIGLLNDKAQLVARPKLDKVSGEIACDHDRQFFYAILTSTDQQKEQQTLACVDFNGVVRWQQRFDSTERTLQLALDTDRGSIWVVRSRQANGPPNLMVFDSNGQSIHKSNTTMSSICYVSSDSAFWLAGGSTIEKRDATNFRELVTSTLPHEVQTITLASAADNGIYVKEQAFRGDPTDTNRLMKFDANGKLVGQIDFGSIRLGAVLDDSNCLLVTGKSSQSDATSSVLRIKHDFTEYEIIPTKYKYLTSFSKRESYFACLADHQLARMSLDGETITPDPAMADQQAELLWVSGVTK